MAKKRGSYKSTLRGYDAYAHLYEEKRKDFARRGYQMASPKMSKIEYEATYEAYRNVRQGDVDLGKRKTIGDINREIVKNQSYEYTERQARGYKAYLAKSGQKAKINDIRAGMINWDLIEKRRDELALDGATQSIIASTISQEFFGSE